MKILVICQNYYPEQFRITDICEELSQLGNDVSVVTGLPNYPEGKIFNGYKYGKKRDEIINGVKVHRCFTIGRRSGAIFRFLNYYSFALSSKWYVKKLKEKFDVVLVNQLSPVMMANAGVTYKKKWGTKLILYCLDLWPESLIAGGIKRNSFIYQHFYKVSEKIYKQCDRILITSKSFSDYFKSKFGIDGTIYLPQYAEAMFSYDTCKKEPDGFIDLMFAGNIGAMQSVETVIAAARLTQDIKNLRFHIVGDGSDLGNVKQAVGHLTNVYFYGKQPLEKMPEFYAKADAMLITMKNDEMISCTLPGKVQTYMAAGKPIIGAIAGETRLIIEEAGCGYCGEGEDAQSLAANIRKFIECGDKEVLAKNARRYYEEHFAKDKFFEALTVVL